MGEFLLATWGVARVLLGIAGLAFVVSASARAGWDWAGRHTRKAPIVQTYRFEKQDSQP